MSAAVQAWKQEDDLAEDLGSNCEYYSAAQRCEMKNDALSGSLIAAVGVYQKKAEGSCKTGITSAARCWIDLLMDALR